MALRRSLGRKLYASFGLVLGATVALGAVALFQMSTMEARSRIVSDVKLPAVVAAGDMRLALGSMVRHQRENVALPSRADRLDSAKEIEGDRADFLTAASRLGAVASNTRDLAALAHIRAAFTTYVSKSAPFLPLSLAGKSQAAIDVINGADPAFEQVDLPLQALIAARIREASVASAGVASAHATAQLIMEILLGFAVVLGCSVAFLITRRIKRSVAPILDTLRTLAERCTSELREGLESMAKGDLTFEVTATTPRIQNVGDDELGRIAEAVNEIRDRTFESLDAYNASREALQGLVGEVSLTSETLSSASQQMATTSEEAGKAVGEIANAVGDVAAGAERQVRMVEEARASATETASQANEAREVALEGVDRGRSRPRRRWRPSASRPGR